MSKSTLPSFFIPHGGGPCFFMDWTMGPADTWDRMAAWLGSLPALVPERPAAVLVISGHWEEPVVTVNSAHRHSLYYDYYGFPPHTYELAYPAAGAPAVAAQAMALLTGDGIANREEHERGLDHGVFIPFKLVYPDADIPVVQISLHASLDPAVHLAIGASLAPLRDQGVLIVGSGMSYHNMQGLGGAPGAARDAALFDEWLIAACEADPAERSDLLAAWETAPAARAAHPREEHLLPLMVAVGAAAQEPGSCIFRDQVLGVAVSGYRFG